MNRKFIGVSPNVACDVVNRKCDHIVSGPQLTKKSVFKSLFKASRCHVVAASDSSIIWNHFDDKDVNPGTTLVMRQQQRSCL